VAFGSLSAAAQNVTYFTTGTFAGAGCAGNICTGTPTSGSGVFTLTFVNAGSNTYGAPTTVDLGSFSTSCAGCGGTLTSASFSGITFTLLITQTAPTAGTGSFSDGVTGSLGWNPITSSLVWMPATTVLTIGGVTYTLTVDNSGNIKINAPTADQAPNLTAVKADIVASTVPEPSTVALMATGLFGLIPVIRRRRS
jgi:hypothetical protein